MSIDAGLFERIRDRPVVSTEETVRSAMLQFAAAKADEHELDLFPETRRLSNIFDTNAAAAEYADRGEHIGPGESDDPGLHTAHGESGHGPMGLICKGAEVGVNKGDQLVDKNLREAAEVKPASAGTGGATRRSATGRAA